MALTEYVDKRHLDKTPEPAGGDPTTGLPTFVVQLHRATRLHYDFRLEAAGVLLSWAVPKGPSLNAKDKRLAMMVEDHPMDYRLFEGIIPKGNYGAGTVMVWDSGTYAAPEATTREEVEHEIKAGLHKGHIAFFLKGEKLRGLFDLIKIKGDEDNAWLLVKRSDEFASEADVTESGQSVLTGRTLEEIRTGAPSAGQVWYSDRIRESIEVSDAPEAEMPRDIRPMLAMEVDRPFDREEWLFEIKWDGYRAIAEVEVAGDIRLYSRNGLSFNERYPLVIADLRQLGHACVLDGEVVVVDEKGCSQFQWLQDYGAQKRGTLLYYAFDLLYLDGHDLRRLPLGRRKELLAQVIPTQSRIRVSDHVEDHGIAFFDLIRQQDLEGMIGKNMQCPYEEGRRSHEWLKVKRLLTQRTVIGGFTQPRNSRKHFGALVVGVYENDELVYVGHTGGGFDDAGLAQVIGRLTPLVRPDCPFPRHPKTNMPVTWVEPELVCEVIFRGWTESALLRQPVFRRLCSGADPKSITRESVPLTAVQEPTSLVEEDTDSREGSTKQDVQPEPAGRSDETVDSPEPVGNGQEKPGAGVKLSIFPSGSRELRMEIGGHSLKLTNFDKVLWADDGYTKGNLIDYYREIAQFILPYLRDRPESLHRHPNGIGQKGFFQKDMPKETPAWIETVGIFSPSHGKTVRYLLCQEEATLVYMANLACIEINPWNSRVPNTDRPDYTVIDLDPVEVNFDSVITIANELRKVLETMEVPSYPKTSGSRGLHIYIPLGAQYDTGQATQFAQLVAQIVHRRLPGITSLERMPARRVGKVYLDYLQNRDGQTLASAYSVRPRPGATVSTPLSWEEVSPGLDPGRFTMRTILSRLEKKGDLWQPVLDAGVDMAAALLRVQDDLFSG